MVADPFLAADSPLVSLARRDGASVAKIGDLELWKGLSDACALAARACQEILGDIKDIG